MLAVLDNFQKMDLDQTKTVLSSSKQFAEKQNAKFRDWAKELCRLGLVSEELLPNFEPIPPSFISLLNEHAQSLANKGKNKDEQKETAQVAETTPAGSNRGGKKAGSKKVTEKKVAPASDRGEKGETAPVQAEKPVAEKKQPAYDPFDPFNTGQAKQVKQQPPSDFNIFDTPTPNPEPTPVNNNNQSNGNSNVFDPFAELAKKPSANQPRAPQFDPYTGQPLNTKPTQSSGTFDPFSSGNSAPVNNDPFSNANKSSANKQPAVFDPFAALSTTSAPAKRTANPDPFSFTVTAAPTNSGPFDILTQPAKPTNNNPNMLNANENPFFGGTNPTTAQPRRNSGVPTFDPFAGLSTTKR
jgi:hypothetical protein